LIGSILNNRYKILREVGSGGMARIYLAQDIVQAEQVAVKMLHPQLNEDPTFIQRFQREAMLARSLDNPHIVRVLEEGVEGQLHYLVMEYVEGPNLYHLIRKKKAFKWQAALNIMRQLALALEHAHAHGVVHRDIKPQNMILTKAGLLMVLDFGIARMPLLPALTQTGAILGSPQYVSPEQVKGKEVSFASDIYSAGLVLYELLAGHSLFEGESAWSIIGHYMSQKPLPLKLPENEIPDRVQSLLNQMLASRPEDRPQASAVREEIEAILTLLSEPQATETGYRLTFQKIGFKLRGWKRTWQLGLVAGAVIIITCLSFLAFGTDTQAETKSRLKSLYAEAHLEIERGNPTEALAKLDQIWREDPDYADVALLRQELSALLLPAPPAMPEVKVPAESGSVEDPLAGVLLQAQEEINRRRWTEAIIALNSINVSPTSEYQQARVAAVLCEAYLGRGLAQLEEAAVAEADEELFIRQALVDFEAGVIACPRRTDLREAAEQASAYLKVLTLEWYSYEKLIETLRPLVATSPDYMQGRARELLYLAYLQRAYDRQLTSEPVAAILADYEAALALRVADPSEAQIRRAKLLQSMVQPAAETVAEEADDPSPESVNTKPAANLVKYKQPVLVGPLNDTIFAGQFSEVYLEWEARTPLAAGEYYDVTIMHLFAGEARYLGSRRTYENRLKIGSEIGVGQAGNDRFYWWVTVRKDGTAPSPGAPDLPLSPQSEARTFIWGL
jgi:serine/threonine-protein kinase